MKTPATFLSMLILGLGASALHADLSNKAQYEMEDAFPGIKFQEPLAVVQEPGSEDTVYIVGKKGIITRISGLESGKPKDNVFLDLSDPADGKLFTDSESGVLGLAFPPNYAQTRIFYVYYSLTIKGKHYQRVSRFKASADGVSATKSPEQPLFSQEDPASNHNGGDLAFGPDGYLYISVGDGGAGNDNLNQGRFINKGFHGGILRIDVTSGKGLQPNPHDAVHTGDDGKARYTVPNDNPFVGATSHHGEKIDADTVRTEFWAVGLRNPWRISFDPESGRLFTGDVGQGLWEEIDLIEKGGDYGWSYLEGTHDFKWGPGGDRKPRSGFKPIDPIYEYDRTHGVSVTGGVVYHGSQFPDLKGKYIFADYGTGKVIALTETRGSGPWKDELLTQAGGGIAGIGVNPATGEILFAGLHSGKVTKLKKK